MQNHYRNLLRCFVLLLVFIGGLSLTTKAQTATITKVKSPVCSDSIARFNIQVTPASASYTVYFNDGTNFGKSIQTDGSGFVRLDTVISSQTIVTIDSVRTGVTTTAFASGPKDTVNSVLTPLVSFITPDTLICSATPMPLRFQLTNGTPNVTYTIGHGNGIIDATSSQADGIITAIVTPTATTTYYVFGAQNDGCFGPDSDAVIVQVPIVPTATITAAADVCDNQTNIPVRYDITGGAPPYNIYYRHNGVDSTKLNYLSTTFTDTFPTLTGINTFIFDTIQYGPGFNCKAYNLDTTTVTVRLAPQIIAFGNSFDTLCYQDQKQVGFNVTGDGTITVRYKAITPGGTSFGFASGGPAAPPAGVVIYNNNPILPDLGTSKFAIDSLYSTVNTAICTSVVPANLLDDTAYVYVKSKPNVTLSPNRNDICPGERVIFNTFAVADVLSHGPYTVTYTLNGGAPQAQNIALGTDTFGITFNATTLVHFVSITDGATNVCTTLLNQDTTISVRPNATVALTRNPATICEGQSSTLSLDFTGAAPYSYQINGGVPTVAQNDTSIVVSPTTTTLYTITQLGDANGCVYAPGSAVTVTVNPRPVVTFNVSSNQICSGSNVNLLVTVNGANSPYSIYFSGEALPLNFTNVPNNSLQTYQRSISSTTNYRLDSLVDNATPTACHFAYNLPQTVTVVPNPAVASISVSTDTICFGDQVTLTFNTSGSGIINVYYKGTDGTTGVVTGSTGALQRTVTPQDSLDVIYTIDSIVDGSGALCHGATGATAKVNVHRTPTATFSGTSTVCEGNTLPLGISLVGEGTITVTYQDSVSGQTYQYSNVQGNYIVPITVPSGTIGSVVFKPTAVNSLGGSNACTGTLIGRGAFTIVKSPTASITSANTNIVAGGSAQLDFTATGVGPFSMKYSDGTTTFDRPTFPPGSDIVTPTVTTTYTITSVTDKGTASLCTTTNLGNVTIIVSNAAAGISGNATICQGDSFPVSLSFPGTGLYDVTIGDPAVSGSTKTFNDKADRAIVYLTPPTTGTINYVIQSVTDKNTSIVSTNTAGTAIANVIQQKSVTISGNSTICEGSNGTITFNLVGSGTFDVTYTDGVNAPVSFSATANQSPIIRSVPANKLGIGPNTFTITNVNNNQPNPVCSIIWSGSSVITVRPTPAVAFSMTSNPVCKGSNDTLKFSFPNNAGPFDVALVTDSASTSTVDSIKSINNGYYRSFVANSNVKFTATQVKYSTSPTCINSTAQAVQVTVNNNPTAVISGTTTICAGTSAPLRLLLTGKLPMSVTYTNGATPTTVTVRNTLDTTVTVSPSATASYSISNVSDGNACSAAGTGSAVVSVQPLPTVAISLNVDSVCQGNNAILKFTTTGAAPFTVSYTENGAAKTYTAALLGDNPLTVTPTVTTVYALTSVKDGSAQGCTRSLTGSDTLIVVSLPNVSMVPASSQACTGDSVRVRATFTGNGTVTATLTDGNNNFLRTVTGVQGIPAFFYVMPVTGSNVYKISLVTDGSTLACPRTNAGQFTITGTTAPTATLTTTSEVCEGGLVDLQFNVSGSGLMTVNFANDRGYQDAFTTTGGATTVTVNPAPETGNIKYYITGIQSSTGVLCSGASTDTAIAIVNPTPIATITATTKTICRGDSTKLTFSVAGNGPFQIKYTDGVNTYFRTLTSDYNGDGTLDDSIIVKPSQTTTFRIQSITDNSNPTCVNNSTVAYTINVNQRPTATLTGGDVICLGDTTGVQISVTGKAPFSVVYSRSDMSGTTNFTIPVTNVGTIGIDTIVPPAAGGYLFNIVSITDSNSPSCTNTAVTTPGATITVNPLPLTTMSLVAPTTICAGDTAQLAFNTTGGTAPWTIVYSAGGVNDTIISTTGKDTILVHPGITTIYALANTTDNSSTRCAQTFTDVDTLIVNQLPKVSIAINAGSPAAVCAGSMTTLFFEGQDASDLDVVFGQIGYPTNSVNLNTDNNGNGIIDNTFGVTPMGSDTVYFGIRSVTSNSTSCVSAGGDSVAVFINPLPTAKLTAAVPSRVCYGDSINLRFDVTGRGTISVVFREVVAGNVIRTNTVTGTSAAPINYAAAPFQTTDYIIESVSSNNAGTVCIGDTVPGQGNKNVVVNPKATVALAGDTTICKGQATDVIFSFPSGTAPFTVEYVTITGTQIDTNVISSSNGGNVPLNFIPTDSTIVYAYRLTDGATPNCVSNDSVGVKINVNPLATAVISGDSVFCQSQNEGFWVTLTGIGNIKFRYKDNFGFPYPEVTSTAGKHFIEIPGGQAIGTRTYTLLAGSLSDQSNPSCIGTSSGIAKVRVVAAPSATFSGISGICEGDSSTITVTLAGSATDSIVVNYKDNFNNTYVYKNRAGTYDILLGPLDTTIYTPVNVAYMYINGCSGSVTGTGEIDVRPTPEATIDVDTSICIGQSVTATFNMDFVGPFDLTYQIGTALPVNVNNIASGYQVTFTPTATVDVKIIQVVYHDIPLCTGLNLDQKTVHVYDSLAVVEGPKVCNDINTGFTKQYTVTGGHSPSYTVNNVAMTSPYTSPFVLNGGYSFTFADNSGCPAVTLAKFDTCACTSYSGTMGNLSLVEACETGVPFVYHNGDAIRDANDTLVFVLTDRNDGIIGNVFGVNKIGPDGGVGFSYNTALQFEKTYFIVPVVSDTASPQGFNTADRCLSVGAGTPVIFHQNSKLDVKILKNDSNEVCVGDRMIIQFKFTGNSTVGPFQVTYNPGFGADTTIVVNGPIVTVPTAALPGSGAIVIKQFIDFSITTGCTQVLDFDSTIPYTARPLPSVAFNFTDNTICQHGSVTFTPTPLDPLAKYTWVFGDNGISTTPITTHVFDQAKTSFGVTLNVVNRFGCTATSNPVPIDVQLGPDADFTISPVKRPYCFGRDVSKEITFTDVTNYPNPAGCTVKWIIDNNPPAQTGNAGNVFKHIFNKPGTYQVKMIFITPFLCSDTIFYPITIEGPEADIVISNVVPCVGNVYGFELKNMKDVKLWSWTFTGLGGYNEPYGSVNPVSVNFKPGTPNGGNITLNLHMESNSGCPFDTLISVPVFEVTAKANASLPTHCLGTPFFVDESGSSSTGVGNAIVGWNWNFGPQGGLPPSNLQNPNPPGGLVYTTPGVYPLTLKVTSAKGCTDIDTVTMTVIDNPKIEMFHDTVCDNMPLKSKSARVINNTNGAATLTWDWQNVPLDPFVKYINDASAGNFSTSYFDITAPGTYTIRVRVTDQNTGCNTLDSSLISMFSLTNPSGPNLFPQIGLDTTYSIGYDLDISELDYFNIDLNNPLYKYSWSPSTGVSCDTCPEPVISTMESETYKITITDVYGCYADSVDVVIVIKTEETLDLPDAFTPNGDNVNEVIYPDGLAIKEILEFKVFNRWGDMVHSGSGAKLQSGWDGKVNGKVQQQDIYSYYVRALSYNGKEVSKKGTFSLIR